MALLCSPPIFRLARSLRNRLLKATTTLPARAAASVRNSFHFSDKIKHEPRPAALGTLAVLGQGPPPLPRHAAVKDGESSTSLRRHMTPFYQHWEQGSFLFHGSWKRV